MEQGLRFMVTRNLFNVSLSIIFAFGFFFLSGVYNAKADDCPDGTELKTVTVKVKDCDITVNVCVHCSATSMHEGSVTLLPFPNYEEIKDCMNRCGLSLNEITNAVTNQISNYEFFYHTLCDYLPPAPPCSSGYFSTIVVKEPICWKIKRVTPSFCTYIGCGGNDVRCETTYQYCYNDKTQLYEKTVVASGIVGGDISCKLESWQVYEPANVGEESDCFVIHTACNP